MDLRYICFEAAANKLLKITCLLIINLWMRYVIHISLRRMYCRVSNDNITSNFLIKNDLELRLI